MGVAWAMILDNRDMAVENKQELAVREPSIKKGDITYDNVLVLCEKFEANCQRYNP